MILREMLSVLQDVVSDWIKTSLEGVENRPPLLKAGHPHKDSDIWGLISSVGKGSLTAFPPQKLAFSHTFLFYGNV